MTLSEQQFYLLLICLPALICSIVVYAICAIYRNRTVGQLREQNEATLADLQNLNDQFQHCTTQNALAKQQIQHLQISLGDSHQQNDTLKHHNAQLTNDLNKAKNLAQQLQVLQQQEKKHHDEKLQQLENSRLQLKIEFQTLAQQILKSTQQEFNQTSREGMENFLQPFRQQITDFNQKVETIHTNDLKQREELKTELKNLQQLNLQMTEEAHQLSTALKGQKKTQGNWGELILENVLDRSGLQQDKDYKREVSISTQDGRKRPDVIVYLPDEKHLIIDSKVSLNAYTRYVNAETEVDRIQALKDHVLALSSRIKELSDKNYFDLPGLKSPEMVFMFVPIESAFVEAIRADETLFQLAIDKQVLVTTPTTLLTSLNIVRQLWRFEDQNKYSARLAEEASKVYNQLRLFLESMDTLGKQLDKARQSYDTALKQFISGKGNLVKRVEDFQKLGVSVQKEMPVEMLEKARLELDLIEHQTKD